MKTYTHNNTQVQITIKHYSNGRPAIVLTKFETGEPYMTASVNLPQIKLDPGEIAIKNYSENTGILEWLYKQGIIERQPTRYIPSGFVKIPICKLTSFGQKLITRSKED